MAAVPVERRGPLSDHALLQRYLTTPQTAGDAFYQAAVEAYLGLYAGVAGVVLDPLEGFRLPGALGVVGAAAGLVKGLGGLAARPVVGLVDGGSKALAGAGLLFLGRRGVQGRLVRRARPPGAAADAPLSRALRARADGGGAREAALRAALVASWQAAIGLLVPPLRGEAVVDVLAARHNRVVVLTAAHVVYLRAEPAAPPRNGGGGGGSGRAAASAASATAAAAASSSTQAAGGSADAQAAAASAGAGAGAGAMSYQLRWVLPCASVVHVRGSEASLRVWLEYYREAPRVRLTLRLNHQLRCANAAVYGHIVRRISRHVGLHGGNGSGGNGSGGGADGASPAAALGAPAGWQAGGDAGAPAAPAFGSTALAGDLMLMSGTGGDPC